MTHAISSHIHETQTMIPALSPCPISKTWNVIAHRSATRVLPADFDSCQYDLLEPPRTFQENAHVQRNHSSGKLHVKSLTRH